MIRPEPVPMSDELLIEAIKKEAFALSERLEAAGRRNITIQITLTEKVYAPGITSPSLRVTAAWKQLMPPSLFSV